MTLFTVAIFCLASACPIPKEGLYSHLEAESREHCEMLASFMIAADGFKPRDFRISCVPASDL